MVSWSSNVGRLDLLNHVEDLWVGLYGEEFGERERELAS